MLFRTALFAIVLVGTLGFLYDADAAAVLPDATPIAENEQAARFVALRIHHAHESLAQGRAGIVLLTTYTAGDLLFFRCIVIVIVSGCCVPASAILLVCRLPLAPTSYGRFAGVFARKRFWCAGFCVVQPTARASVLT